MNEFEVVKIKKNNSVSFQDSGNIHQANRMAVIRSTMGEVKHWGAGSVCARLRWNCNTYLKGCFCYIGRMWHATLLSLSHTFSLSLSLSLSFSFSFSHTLSLYCPVSFGHEEIFVLSRFSFVLLAETFFRSCFDFGSRNNFEQGKGPGSKASPSPSPELGNYRQILKPKPTFFLEGWQSFTCHRLDD